MKVCCCNNDVVKTASGSGAREELELEYVSESSEEEFRTPPPDLMTMVIEGHTPQGMFPVTIKFDNDD